MRTLAKDTVNKIGEEVTLMGWVGGRRDHGKLIFLDLRDRWGTVQVVFSPKNQKVLDEANLLRLEWVIELTGFVKERPKNMINPEIPTGSIEIEATGLVILSQAHTPPFDLTDDGYAVGEEHRMKYRYIDLRRKRLQKNLLIRHRVIHLIRNFLDKKEFLEIETPVLTRSTPEGARDYVVPSRLYPGMFYALPQSPQQYKQLLMVGGVEKYFQIARCFRDEDTRGDRQPEFTQLDLEMSFVEREEIMDVSEALLVEIVKNITPEKHIQEIPFPRVTYKEAMEKYGTDRPDLRKDKSDPNLFAFCWVTDFPFFEKTAAEGWTFTHNPFSRPKKEFVEITEEIGRAISAQNTGHDDKNNAQISKILTTQYDIILNGFEIGGGSIRNHKPGALNAVFKIMGYNDDRIRKNFGHMLEALSFGAPPHGGIAWGLDRLIMLLTGEPNIREVIAFPKTGDARDLMMDSPAELDPQQLKELGIISKKQK